MVETKEDYDLQVVLAMEQKIHNKKKISSTEWFRDQQRHIRINIEPQRPTSYRENQKLISLREGATNTHI